MPVDDKYSTTRNEILDQLAYALGGRVAEEMIFHDPTTGAANDIEKATGLARKMVTQFGMSERIGAIKLGQEQGEVFLGRDMGHQRDYSEDVAGIVDEEVRRLHRVGPRRGLARAERQPRRAGRPRPRAAREGDAEQGPAGRDLRRRSSSGRSARSGSPATGGHVSDQPPVLTPAERAAMANGNGPLQDTREHPPHRGDRGARGWPCRPHRRLTSSAPSAPSVSCCSPSARTPTATG